MEDINIREQNILEIVDSKHLQTFQDFFASTLDVSLVMSFNGKWVTKPSNDTVFCKVYAMQTENGLGMCLDLNLKNEELAKKQQKPIISICPLGLTTFVVPLIIENKYMGCILGGQIATKKINRTLLKEFANKTGGDEKGIIKESKSIKIFTEKKVKATTDILFLVANTFVNVKNTNSKLAEMGIGYKLIPSSAVKQWFQDYCQKPKRLLTERELQVLKLIVKGKNNSEIAKELIISIHTAKAHVSSILEKFEVDDRVQVAVKAVREGFI